MSSHVVLTFLAKPDSVESLVQQLTEFQDRSIHTGAITASLMQDENDSNRLIEEEVWLSAEHHQRFLAEERDAGSLASLEALLASPVEVSYLDTLKYSRNRQH